MDIASSGCDDSESGHPDDRIEEVNEKNKVPGAGLEPAQRITSEGF